MRIAAAQTPEFREDLPGAVAYLAGVMDDARRQGAGLLCLPEGFLQGYLTEAEAARRHALDLASPAFAAVLDQLPRDAPSTVVGLIEADGEALYNTAAVIAGGTLVGRYRKRRLLRGERCFQPGDAALVFETAPAAGAVVASGTGALRFGVNICFDSNFPELAQDVARQGATLLLCPANNMLRRDVALEWKHRHNAVRAERCRETGLWLMSADITGERDGQVAWGPTAVIAPSGQVVAQLPLDAPGLLVFELPDDGVEGR